MDKTFSIISNCKLLFIGGAPRSGTTLFLNQLDSHPELLCFPMEHKTIENYFWNEKNKEEYFFNDFIANRKEGQQSILANQEYIDDYINRIKTIYNKDFSLEINTTVFKEKYVEYLTKEGVSLNTIFRALGFALLKANEFALKKQDTIKYLVFKQPFYTELFAQEVNKQIPEVKFIQLIRDPFARYLSAKTRRLKDKKKLSHINRVNYVEGHSTIDICCKTLSQKNQIKIGTDNYKNICFEELIQKKEKTFSNIFSFLGIDSSFHSYAQATRLGVLAPAGSSLVKTKKGAIDQKVAQRTDSYLKETTWNERLMHKYYLNKSGLFEITKPNFFLITMAFLVPLPNSNLKNIYFQYKGNIKNLLFSSYRWKDFLKEAKGKTVAVSGNI